MLVTFNTHCWKSFVSRVVQFFSRGASHSSIQVGDFVWEATFDKGVIKTPLEEWEPLSTVVDKVHFEIPRWRGKELVQWLDRQVGKGYDFLGILSFIWILIPQKVGKWYCSEMNTVALYKFIVQAKEYIQKKNPREHQIELHIFKGILW